MERVALDLPAPAALRGRWAAWAAVHRAGRAGRGCRAAGPVWHYDDGGGNWLELHHLDGGRAVLVGHDHECSPEPEEGIDLLAGAPEWWAPVLRAAVREYEFVGFLYGFDGAAWSRAPYEVDDGFRAVNLPALTREATHRRIADACRYDPRGGRRDASRPAPSEAAVDALIAADGDVTEELLAAVVGAGDWETAAGAAHARRFLEAHAPV
ncbi:proteophosphoglycan 5 [Streptomyces marincola]|uniref:proteophosphoglycan 5 n=1 Tax=Streptomyces marincola TaxID=2878388 RepID=UPI001CF56B11|nr:proteophosphoglycan 5 [Streptomyces marincola]UCM88952.1 proteophosphoglycan 5 [Streptomyces marincola]